MIITLANFKLLSQISVSTYDSIIEKLIPMIEESIVKYCNNEFIDIYKSKEGVLPTVYTYSNTISFLNSDNSLNDLENDFTTMNFKVGDTIRVYNSLHNDKPLTIDSIAANKIILNSINTINDENLGNTIVFARVDYPSICEFTAALMIKFKLEKIGIWLKSEKIDDYSYTRDDKIVDGFPSSIMSGLNDVRSVFFKTIPFSLLYYRQE